MYKILASDLDNTALLDGHLTEVNKQAIQKACNAGMEFVAVTGRGLSAVAADFYDIEGFNYAITSNGACISNVRTGEIIRRFTVTEENTEKLLRIGLEKGAAFEIFVDGRAYVSEEYYADPAGYGMPERLVSYIKYARTPIPDIIGYIREHMGQIDNFVYVVKNAEMHKAVADAVREQCPDSFIVDCDHQWVEVMNVNCNKGNGLKILAEFLGISRNEIVAFGDGDNDIEMLEYAGTSIAMGNASKKLKAVADRITLGVNSNGLAYEIERILK